MEVVGEQREVPLYTHRLCTQLYPPLYLSGPLTTAIQMFKDANFSYNMAFEYKPRPSGAQPETVMCSNPDCVRFPERRVFLPKRFLRLTLMIQILPYT